MGPISRAFEAIDSRIGASTFGRVFRLEGCGHEKEIKGTKFLTEIRAGISTFFTMAYIISVNASILKDTGGTCVCDAGSIAACKQDAAFQQCVVEVQRDLITATAAISGLASFLFGFLTNMPVALAPGMGLNAYMAYQVVGVYGTGRISYRLALTAVFIEGFVFIFLSLIGMRQWLVKLLPTSLKLASACGIGMFLALIGLSYDSGIGAVTGGATATPLELGGCPPQYLDPVTGTCQGHLLQNTTLWIGITLGGVLTAILMSYKVKSAIIIGILVVSIVSWPRGTEFTYFPHTPAGDQKFDFFKKVVTFRPIEHTLNVLDFNIAGGGSQFALALFTFLYVDIVDCTATLFSMARYSGVVDENGDFPRSTIAYCTDALSISIGALFGSSPVTAFIESGAGIAEGGKTGLTAMTTGICFIISIFFAPIFASIPPWATGCTLVLVGCMMMRQVIGINWRYIGDAVPAFVTIMFVPFSYSTAYGLIAGIMVYCAINLPMYLIKVISREHIVPEDEDSREYWTIKPAGQLPWFITISQTLTGKLRSSGSSDTAFNPKSEASSIQYGEQPSSQHNTNVGEAIINVDPPRHQYHNADSVVQYPGESSMRY